MAKKIRFPLEMDNGVEVRSVEELRDNFSIARVIEYLKDGKLITWLRDRYMDDLADAVEQMDLTDAEIVKKISEIFDVSFDETSEQDLEKATERIERLKRLKEFTYEQKYQNVIDQVAFDQDELYDLLDDGVTVIYLCGERFSIPLAKPGITYIGINHPIAIIDSKEKVEWKKKKILVKDMIFDDKYQAVLDRVDSIEENKMPQEQISKESNDKGDEAITL